MATADYTINYQTPFCSKFRLLVSTFRPFKYNLMQSSDWTACKTTDVTGIRPLPFRTYRGGRGDEGAELVFMGSMQGRTLFLFPCSSST